MPTENPDLGYKPAPARQAQVAYDSWPEDWLARLTQAIEANLESALSFDLAARLNEHVGSHQLIV